MKICMIGNRGHNAYVLDGLKLLPEAKVVGLCAATDDISNLVRWCSDNGHSPKVFDDYRLMMDEARPDVVTVCGPFELHAAMCMEAFGRGIHAFSEKPVAATLEELALLREAHAKAKVHFAAMMGMRYEPAFYTAWAAVRKGAVGKVRLLSARKSYKLGKRDAFYMNRVTSSGTIPWVGSHAIDLIHWFSGESFQSVYAAHSSLHNRDHGDLEVSAMCQFSLTNQVFASASIDYLRPAGAPTHGDDRIRVAGTDGVVEVAEDKVTLIDGSGHREEKAETPWGRQIFRDFIEHAQGKTAAILTPEDTFVVTEACLLARRSADEGRLVFFQNP